jgi:hypothetical protein
MSDDEIIDNINFLKKQQKIVCTLIQFGFFFTNLLFAIIFLLMFLNIHNK